MSTPAWAASAATYGTVCTESGHQSSATISSRRSPLTRANAKVCIRCGAQALSDDTRCVDVVAAFSYGIERVAFDTPITAFLAKFSSSTDSPFDYS
jgi:hypothetical protein